MMLYKNGVSIQTYDSYYEGKNIIIGIDSSKTNTAIAVGNEYNEVLDDYEISGAGSGVDVYELCWETRKQLKKLFKGANILAVGIEDIITKKENGYKGIDIHTSRAKITAVFNNIIFSFQEYYNIMPRLINNQEWKSNVLPAEFRTRDHKKGSKDYFKHIGDKRANRTDDVTDAVCILTYVSSFVNKNVINKIYEVMPTRKKYNWGFYPIDTAMPQKSKQFEYNNKYTLTQLTETMMELMSKHDNYGYMKIPLSALSMEDIYSGKMMKSYPKMTTEVLLVVKEKEAK